MKKDPVPVDRKPDIDIDDSLDKYKNVVCFPEKLAKANENFETDRTF
ncbi:hypothetical protein [Ilyomonas limi]|jgi:hypothetical protein|nr:hypothetical protein [Ilyomonas limi]